MSSARVDGHTAFSPDVHGVFVEMVHKQGLEDPLELRDEQDVVQAVSG